MPGITLLIMIVIVVAIIWLFLHDSRQAPGSAPSSSGEPEPSAAARPPPSPSPEPPLDSAALEALAEHVRGLRKAVDEGLIGRDEAIESIVRQGEGRVGTHAAEQLLDSAEMD